MIQFYHNYIETVDPFDPRTPLSIWLCSFHSVKNISPFKCSASAPKPCSQVTRCQALYLIASCFSVVNWTCSVQHYSG